MSFAHQPAAPVQRASDLDRPTEPPIVHERYTGWMLAADALAIVPLTYWMSRPDDAYLAIPSLLLPPLVHTLHGESGHALASLVLRGAMVGGVYLAARSAESECESSSEFICIPFRSFLLAEVAIVSVIAVDSVFLSRTRRRAEGWRSLPLQPSVGVSADGRKWLTIGGRF